MVAWGGHSGRGNLLLAGFATMDCAPAIGRAPAGEPGRSLGEACSGALFPFDIPLADKRGIILNSEKQCGRLPLKDLTRSAVPESVFSLPVRNRNERHSGKQADGLAGCDRPSGSFVT